jgi:hypothetical protein
MKISITIDQSARSRALFAKLGDLPEVALAAVARGMSRAGQVVLGQAVKNRFTGQGPFPVAQNRLGVVTNRLRKSLRVTRPQINAGSSEVTMGFGSDVKYFGLHEFGFKGKVQVRGHTRRSVARDTPTPKGKVNRAEVNRRKVAILVKSRGNYSYVRPHARNLNIAARAPMSTQLRQDSTAKSFLLEISRELSLALTPNTPPLT